MFDKTTRRGNREPHARVRLARLCRQARAEPPASTGDPPTDQEWVDLSGPPRAKATPAPSTARHRGDPWWRRGRPGRLVERWMPGGADAPVPRRRPPVVLIVGLALGAAVAGGVVLSSGSAAREAEPALPVAHATPGPTGPAADGKSIVVSVVGLVVRPGLVTLSDGARVADAVRAAGGPAPGVDLGGLNLARRVADGEQVSVGVAARPDTPSGALPGTGSGAGDRIDLNSASVAQLDMLPGVGQVTAQRILDWRTKHGPFTRVEQLREVDGIGPARFTRLKELVVVR